MNGSNRVWARLEELETRMLLASNLSTAIAPTATSVALGSPQTSVLSVGFALIAVPMDAGTVEGETAARSTGDYFLNNQPVGGLPPTPAMLQTVSRLPSLSQGIDEPDFGGGGVESRGGRDVNWDGSSAPAEEMTDVSLLDGYFASSESM